ncbi:uncharacterized protein I303_101326 [Kwoniella dejecticola CBS 10117]|uniref:Zn(2)-C6 fungal-type domain-containing protein n=1 Tax=Kwoniella dejecticola CBS 10117 TaxID=1296121 RepID=A0A1A6AHG1_9TREE|nr:uncharacterized protein I303_01335 [Kwoniella dejecticola CBS 10117]OBR89507.1 hypothetical protein I303_01335 [Kwoniella dejecticola CBS 10117]
MNPTPPYDDILEDETLAPLKRNHACLQCKKRKVKCDATKPTCAPCMRSHAHAVRSAHRNGTTPPVLTCTYAEGDSPEPEAGEENKARKKKPVVTSSGSNTNTGVKRQHVGQGHRETPDEEKENLKARIAELEARLATLTPPSSHSNIEPSLPLSSNAYNINGDNNMPFASQSFSTLANGSARVEPILEEIGNSSTNINFGISNTESIPLPESLGDFSGLDDFFLVPKDWPKGLPLPFLLEHLVETFFNYVPQTPRMLHRASLLARIKLPPSSPDFPFPGLLHAICASAAGYTAWVNNLAPHMLEESVQRHLALGLDLTTIDDFGLAQAHLGAKAVELTTSVCIMGSGPLIFQLVQACILLGDAFFTKGFPMKGWMMGGHPARLLAVLELCNRQPRTHNHKQPLLKAPETDMEREERLITTWMAFTNDAGYTINSNWAPSMMVTEVRCNLPTSYEDWCKVEGMVKNPQNASSHDLYYSHPIEDSFIFVIKGSVLMATVASWLRNWQQREKEPDDEMEGCKTDEFKALNHRIETFSTSLPAALKNIFRYLDSRSMGFDANLLSIHLIPNVATCLLHEPFMLWQPYDPSTIIVQRAYDNIMAVLHLIPSNLDIALILTPSLAMSLYTVGRFITDFIKHADSLKQIQTAVRYRADLRVLINLLDRYGQRHPLGNAMVHFLEQYTQAAERNTPVDPNEMCKFNVKRVEYVTSPDEAILENIESTYINKINTHAEISGQYANSSIKGNINGGSSSGSRSASISGISPNTMLSNLSNQPTPESITSFCNSTNGEGCILDFDGNANASSSINISPNGDNNNNNNNNNHNNTNGTSNNGNTNPTQIQQAQINIPQWDNSPMTKNATGVSTAFDHWDKSFHTGFHIGRQPGEQLPMMTFLGNLGTDDSVQPLPIPIPVNDPSGQYENPEWKHNLFTIPGTNIHQ